MKYKENELKQGIKIHTINTNKFKTNLLAVFLTTELNRKTVTKNALISMLLRRGSKNMSTQEEISKQMEEMYGASFDCGLDKTGDNQVLKFYIEVINDDFLPQNNDEMLKKAIQKLLEIVFDPYTEGEGFKKEYIEQEKENLKQKIVGKIDNKARYAIDRCIEEMYGEKAFGLYKFGYVEDLNNIDEKELYLYYKNLINSCKIDIFVSGNIKENIVTESMEATQGKLILGLDVNIDNEELKYDTVIYNSILGGTANSKMFQNVREKAHLAYVASSSYLRHKNIIFVNCGIEISNYQKALNLIKQQIEDMKQGDFTEEDIANAKKGILATIKTIDDEQDTQISYYFGQELTNTRVSTEEYIKKIEKIQKEDVINIARKVSINTIYFLKD